MILFAIQARPRYSIAINATPIHSVHLRLARAAPSPSPGTPQTFRFMHYPPRLQSHTCMSATCPTPIILTFHRIPITLTCMCKARATDNHVCLRRLAWPLGLPDDAIIALGCVYMAVVRALLPLELGSSPHEQYLYHNPFFDRERPFPMQSLARASSKVRSMCVMT